MSICNTWKFGSHVNFRTYPIHDVRHTSDMCFIKEYQTESYPSLIWMFLPWDSHANRFPYFPRQEPTLLGSAEDLLKVWYWQQIHAMNSIFIQMDNILVCKSNIVVFSTSSCWVSLFCEKSYLTTSVDFWKKHEFHHSYVSRYCVWGILIRQKC